MANGCERAKVLSVMSPQFGELANAVYFAQEPMLDSLLLVPPALHAVHARTLSAALQPYDSLQDVIAAAQRWRPDLVLFFSGYLFADHKKYTVDDLGRLVGALRQQGCRLATTDPFLGLLADLPDKTFEKEARAYAFLKDHPHLYTVDPKGFATTVALTFSQGRLVRPPAQQQCPAEIRQAVGLDPARPLWVFVLAIEDYWPNTEFDGRPFDDLLADQIHEALYQGKQPVLIAPPACALNLACRSLGETQFLGFQLAHQDQPPEAWGRDVLGELAQLVFQETDGLVLLPYCRYDWFLSLILAAEYAFYWNQCSNSLFVRMLNRLPTFFFDRGHMARYSKPLYERYVQCCYLGCEPPSLALNEPVEAGQLARWAAEQEGTRNALADHLLRALTPAQVAYQILRQAV